jgi:hypothetical protein
VVIIRRFLDRDAPTLWALNDLPDIGATADPGVPLPRLPAADPPAAFPDLADILAEMFLDTATNQPEAMAFYQHLGYREIGRRHKPGWSWTLVDYVKTESALRLAGEAP